MKIRCGKVKRLIIEFAAGELSHRVAKTVKGHINMCAKCRDEYEQTRQTLRLLTEVPLDMPPEGIQERVLHRLLAKTGFQRPVLGTRLWRQPIFAGAVAVLLLVTGLLVMIFSERGPDKGRLAKSPGERTVSYRISGKIDQSWDEYLAQTNDAFYKIAFENQSDLKKLLGDTDLPARPGEDIEEELLRKVAMAMKLKKDLNPETDPFAFSLLEDVEGVWRQVYKARKSFPERIEDIRKLILQEQLLDRIDQLID